MTKALLQFLVLRVTPFLVLGGLTTLLFSDVVFAQNTDEICRLILESGEECSDDGSIRAIVTAIIDVLSIVTGVLSVIMIIIGGLRYIVSGGDSAKVVAAKNTILYAIVGLVIVIFAQTIVQFVVGRVSSTE